MARKYNLCSASDMRRLSRDLKKSITRSKPAHFAPAYIGFNVTCPQCQSIYEAHPDVNFCPICQYRLDIDL